MFTVDLPECSTGKFSGSSHRDDKYGRSYSAPEQSYDGGSRDSREDRHNDHRHHHRADSNHGGVLREVVIEAGRCIE